MVIGNNDNYDFCNFYKQCGFTKIYKNPVLIQNPIFKPFDEGSKLLFSHEPIDIEKEFGTEESNKILNIHGHIHGTKTYWDGINPKNHIDCYYGLYEKPMRLSELIKFYNSGKYLGLSGVK